MLWWTTKNVLKRKFEDEMVLYHSLIEPTMHKLLTCIAAAGASVLGFSVIEQPDYLNEFLKDFLNAVPKDDPSCPDIVRKSILSHGRYIASHFDIRPK